MTRRRWAWTIALLAVVLLAVWLVDHELAITAGYRGSAMARLDWWRGHREIKLYGLPSDDRPRFLSLLRSRYGVRANEVALCTVSHNLVAYADAYNDVVWMRLKEEYGHDVVAELSHDLESETSDARH